ncbi:hypothetical protein [Burkholderia gladioli]|uniref:hypothetical protein n=1 Tax=Burkholderia gladioli TaxID=28095 RepID=UPI001640ABAB|nr:hypothetical protein [Burkholderia gladioli]
MALKKIFRMRLKSKRSNGVTQQAIDPRAAAILARAAEARKALDADFKPRLADMDAMVAHYEQASNGVPWGSLALLAENARNRRDALGHEYARKIVNIESVRDCELTALAAPDTEGQEQGAAGVLAEPLWVPPQVQSFIGSARGSNVAPTSLDTEGSAAYFI